MPGVTAQGLLILLYSVLTVACAALQAVAFKSAGYALGPFPYFILLSVSFAFVPIFFLGVCAVDRVAVIAPEGRAFEYKKAFALIGILNALNGVLIIFSNPHVSGVAQSTLSQFVIPLTLGLSVCILRASFTPTMYAGAFVILCGVAVELAPSFLPSSTSHNQHHHVNFSSDGSASVLLLGGGSAAAAVVSGSGWWAVVFALGQVPAALCSIYQEQAFTKGVRINVVYMMAWSSLAQFCFLVVVAPLNFIPGFGNLGSVEAFVGSLGNATMCLADAWPGHPECAHAGTLLGCCVATMLLTNMFQALLVKNSSASLSVLVLTLITPVSTFCFTLPALMGKNTETMSALQWVALLVLMIGVSLYRYADVKAINAAAEAAKAAARAGDGAKLGSKDEEAVRKSSSLSYGTQTSGMSGGAEKVGPRSSRTYSGAGARSLSTTSSRPLLMSTRSGIINCEYTGGAGGQRQKSAVGLFFQGTVLERRKLLEQAHHSEPLLSSSTPNQYTAPPRMVHSAKKAPRPSSSLPRESMI